MNTTVLFAAAAAAGAYFFLSGKPKRKSDASGGPEGTAAPGAVVTGHFVKPTGKGLGALLLQKIKSAKDALCTRPMQLSAGEQLLLRIYAIGPSFKNFPTSQPSFAALDAAFKSIANQLLASCAKQPQPESKDVAYELVRSVWQQKTGQSGQ